MKLINPVYNYPIAVKMPIFGYSSQAKANTSESFVSFDGNTCTDIRTEPGYPNTKCASKHLLIRKIFLQKAFL
jgi:hypothetical protein